MMRILKPHGQAERATQTTVDTIEVTRKGCNAWKVPPFQREVRANAKVMALVDEIRVSGVIPGVLTLGVLDQEVYIVDGQHRLFSYMQSELPIAYADVRTHHFRTMGEMANEFVKLNSALVRLRPDDILRGLEQSNANLQKIRRKCAYVGYDGIRRNANKAPVLSMSAVVRGWVGSEGEVPGIRGSVSECLDRLDSQSTDHLVNFLELCFTSWRRDPEYARLWGALNLGLCAWLYRRVVIGDAGKGTSRSTKMEPEQFKRGLLALSAETDYLDYLMGRALGERDRAPAYNRMKAIMARRYGTDTGGKLLLPSPAWAHTRQ